ncbi:TPA: type 1 fimbrial protein [Pseudomonas aeruginosa]|uniref:fimbrial protein n=1 Tax=Pseudomonas TaxID=286 RepID=UPI00053D0B37|nr:MULTISPECIES: fimbrial protein [Pseudomonas]MBA4991523.1 type 1 fimbrial protein [Pseudomonas aeruginosa]MBG4396401.1 type 1 fimbrial protein [Pseudomonas aeruginosa]MBL4545883.1 type 1 fimbrial protein [Pseudomonas aeruginosa]MDA3274538.1 type 1 fimbrial protein [Pseudomonas aeruginosa]MDG3600510.1 type 1 fimbrial protein [Pseudomonas aeruginosa]
MSISMKSLLAAAVASLVVGNAMAADGTINFTGEITAASCNITGGAGTNVGGSKGNQTIDVNLGKVSIDALGGTAGGGIAGGTNINLELDCGDTGTGLTTVKVKFDPRSGSGIDTQNVSLLKTTGTATGVGIGIYDTSGNLLNLSANETFDAPLVKEGTDPKFTYSAKLDLRAGYVKSGSDAPQAGTANGTLPFTLTYN